MFTRFVTFLLALSIFSVTAHASAQNGLKEAFDELNYTLTVEWDQKDKVVYNKAMDKFNTTLASLQEQGLSTQEMVEFVKSEVKDAKVAKELQTAFNMIQINRMSPADASNYMMETMRRSYNQGASWNGSGVVVGVFVAVLLVAAAVATGVIVWSGPKCGHSYSKCGATCEGFDCDDNYCCWD